MNTHIPTYTHYACLYMRGFRIVSFIDQDKTATKSNGWFSFFYSNAWFEHLDLQVQSITLWEEKRVIQKPCWFLACVSTHSMKVCT